MGSEHYCLRWNNHQSNLLGVFSQLLQDESLVDVTLACSEGASIRAHKVVLSACSSYFQSLFLDHPSRHPIVILKDVRFSELRTLVEFMYKGEVNVQYCQLSALLKTAESLKVKGLAEMTNQNTALRETEREPERLRPHSAPKPETMESSSSSTSSVKASRLESTERCSPSPTRLPSTTSPLPLDLFRKSSRVHSPPSQRNLTNDDQHPLHTPYIHQRHHHRQQQISPIDDRPSSPDDDDALSMHSSDVGINMTLNSNSITSATGPPSITIPTTNNDGSNNNHNGNNNNNNSNNGITQQLASTSDLRPSSRGCISSVVSNSGNLMITTNALGSAGSATSLGLGAPISSSVPSPMSEPIAGPSGMGPVQQVPLSLKKEIDWDRHDEKMCAEGQTDFRHPHDTEATEPHGGGAPPEQGGSMYPCLYCGTSFPHQSKLTRHILSHSLETLKYRESRLQHPGHLTSLMPHELPPQHFVTQRTALPLEPLEPPDGGPMDIEYATSSAVAAAAAAAAAASSAATSGNSTSSGYGDQGNVVLCKFCGKSFPDVSSLIAHLPVHTGDRPFKCEFCGKAFKLRHHMKDHCRVHTGERPFRCGMCGKTFSRSTILKAHEKTHFPKYVRKFLSPSTVDSKDDLPQ